MGESRTRSPAGGLGAGRPVLAVVLAALLAVLSACSGGGPRGAAPAAPTTAATSAAATSATPAAAGGLVPRGPVDRGWRVSRVVDGDTVHVTRAGVRLKVRVLGIDTPETVAPGEPVGCFGPEASAFARGLLLDRAVALEYDDSQGRTDRYGRTLAYVWLETTTPGAYSGMYEIDALRAGVAREYLYDRPYAWRDAFVAAEQEARRAGRGLWSACPSP